tara:strand:+ start:2734 stop:3480 length:747 start_codon:yes stop_codon:yes gene_type:complete
MKNSTLKYSKVNPKLLVILVFLCVFSIQTSYSQLSIGGSIGFQIPGRQDLKFKQYNNRGVLSQYIKSTYVQSNISTISNLHLTYWEKQFGLRLEYLKWEHNSVAKEFLNNEIPEFNSTEQSRNALYLNVMKRLSLPFIKPTLNSKFDNGYSYFGLGYGVVLTEINRGLQRNIRSGIQLSYGVNFPISKRLRTFAEFKYILTRDADNTSAPVGKTVVDTSGAWTLFRLGPHIDTKYHVIQFGFQWDIFK